MVANQTKSDQHPWCSPAPRIVILGVGQMGLVCSAILADPDRLGVGPNPNVSGAILRGDDAQSNQSPIGFKASAPTGGRAKPLVSIWGHSAEEAAIIAQVRRSDRLPTCRVPDDVVVTTDPARALSGAAIIISAVPVQYSRSVWNTIRAHVPSDAGVVSVAKGIENDTLLRPVEIIADTLGEMGRSNAARAYCVLSGPTIASELARCMPATMVAASDDEAFRRRVQDLFTTRWMRIYTSNDVLGVELAGAMKNVIAIAAGIVDGLGAGSNAKSALLARGLAEIARLGVAMGASADTFFGIAGAGDLATSCFSPEGRNRSCGEALGRGRKLAEYLAQSRSVVEGVATTRSVMDLARKYRVDMPITSAVHSVLFEGMDPIECIGLLMTREPKAERVG